MGAEIDHRAFEARISHHRHGDQQLAVQIATPGRIVAGARGFAVNKTWSFTLRVHPQRTLVLTLILILGGKPVNQASRRLNRTSQAIQWFTGMPACKDAL